MESIRYTAHSLSLLAIHSPLRPAVSVALKCTFKFFPEQFFSPLLFYISMPVPRGIKSHAINSIFMQSTLCLDITFSPWWWNTNIYVNRNSERRKEPPAEFADLMFTSGCLTPALQRLHYNTGEDPWFRGKAGIHNKF